MKTKKIVAKRFKITKNGKILHRAQGRRHLRRKKSKSRQRRQDKFRQITNTKEKTRIKRYIKT
ncbi:MAG: bL35 family ribosomal protein [Patescibacteria group bacterium]